jgi:aspartate racemase
MRRLGLLGGVSWESTALYYRLANEVVRDRLGGLHSAECVLYSVDFAPIERMQAEGRWDEVGQILAVAARSLESSGAQLLVLCSNTLHKVAGTVEAAVTIPLLHIGDATGQAAQSAGLRRLGLLGTAYTMEQDFYRSRLEAYGMDVLIPPASDRALIHRVIFDELCAGIISAESRQACRQLIGKLVAAGADGIVLGCTELELLLTVADSPVPLLPTTSIHVNAAVTMSLAAD